ncbi:class D beta-lactamase [Ferruginibacter lapsinanis]|uniref:class D beta-lactamase n=1 Tax=Ferruginibacter lapsinanis TaxID=563172 RepID=UPI001E476744|nr:class D beta-lactamase [Ferruginibacter lapsinanis]UEG50437.1 class D beta-lactamase [Ferruginibacter lapsinanis]
MKRILTFLFLISCSLLLITSCSVNRAKIDDSLKKYFDENKVDGCFTMFSNSSGKVTVYNMRLDTMRFLPASTFKIVNALVGIETGRITDEKMIIKWDGVKRPVEEWNKDLTMEEAFKVSSVPYFQEVARKIGKDTMQHWLDTLNYGTRKITTQIDSFWLDNSLKISPDEQLGLVKRLYFDQLPFQKRTQQIVRDAMVQEDNTLYKLSYKSGWGVDEQKTNIGWLVGWIEENKHPYFFALLVKSPDANIDMQKVRENIIKGILKQLGFLEGKM